MVWFGLFAVYAMVHIFVVKDIFYSHTAACQLATRLPLGLSTLAMTALNCQLCLGFWIGTVSCLFATMNILYSVFFGLACYAFVAIVSKIVDDEL
jgi:hypothetical protein